MGRIYSRPRRLNKRFCLYLIIAVSTVAFVGYQWSNPSGSHPLSLFSLHEYSSDLPQNPDDPGPTNLRDDDNVVDAADGLVDDTLEPSNPSTDSLMDNTVNAASNGASQSLEYLAKKVRDTQDRMFQLFGLAKTNLPEAGVSEGLEDNLPFPEGQAQGAQPIEGLDGVTVDGTVGNTLEASQAGEEATENDSEGFEDSVSGFAVKTDNWDEGDIDSRDEEQNEGEEEEEEDASDFAEEEEDENEEEEAEDEEEEVEEVDEEEEEDNEGGSKKKNRDEDEDEENEDEEDEEQGTKKKKKKDKSDNDDEEKGKKDKKKKKKSKKKNKVHEDSDNENDEDEDNEDNENDNGDEEDYNEEEDEDERDEEETERDFYDENENNDEYPDEDEEKNTPGDYSSKQEVEEGLNGQVGSTPSRFNFDGVDSQNYDGAEGRDEGLVDAYDGAEGKDEGLVDAYDTDSGVTSLQQQLVNEQQSGLQQQQGWPTTQDQSLAGLPTDGSAQGVMQMQMPPPSVIQSSLGVTNETDVNKIQQLYAAYRNATSEPTEDVQDMTKQLVDEGKERLKTHVSALQLLKMKQELVRDGLSPELADRFLSSPDPMAVARTFPLSAQLIIRKDWDSLREQLNVLEKGSTLEHITASNDLLRPAEVQGGLTETSATSNDPWFRTEAGNEPQGTTVPTGQGYDNPRPLSQDQFDKLNTPPTLSGPETTNTPPTAAEAEQFYRVQVGGTLKPGSFVSFRKSPSGAAQIDVDPRRLPFPLRDSGNQPPSVPVPGSIHSLPLGDTPAESAQPPEPLNLIPIDSNTGSAIPGAPVSSPSIESAGQPPSTTPSCPIQLRPSMTSHPVTALVAFPGEDTDWLRRVLEQLSGEESDSIYKIMADLKDGHTSGVRLMGRKVAIETHAAATNDFERAIVVIENPFAVEEKRKTLRPPSVDWQKTFLWGRLYTFWLHTDISLLVVIYEDLVNNPLEELKKIAQFLSLPLDPAKLQCALEIAQKPPKIVTDVMEIAGIYSKDRSRINDNIESVKQVAMRRFPDIVDKLEKYKIHAAHTKK